MQINSPMFGKDKFGHQAPKMKGSSGKMPVGGLSADVNSGLKDSMSGKSS